MAWSSYVKRIASDPKTQAYLRQAAAQVQEKAKDPATRAKVDAAVEEARRRLRKR